MNKKNITIPKICLILITIAILIGVGFYCWSVWERQVYFKRQQIIIDPSVITPITDWIKK